jgi:hypothetical protein
MIGIATWERSALVVNTIGSYDHADMPPALTCQARPQDGECFGEFPPRHQMDQCTIFPVIIPSSNPSYDTVYTEHYLQSRSHDLHDDIIKSTRALLTAIADDAVRGYCVLLIEYLQNACHRNPKRGTTSESTRTVLYGIQTPPLGTKTVLRCTSGCTWDDVAPIYVLFHATNARHHAELSIRPDDNHDVLVQFCRDQKLPHTVESDTEFAQRMSLRTDIFQCVAVTAEADDDETRRFFPMVGNFVSLYLPCGHIKSTMDNDEEFAVFARLSDKWLTTLF